MSGSGRIRTDDTKVHFLRVGLVALDVEKGLPSESNRRCYDSSSEPAGPRGDALEARGDETFTPE